MSDPIPTYPTAVPQTAPVEPAPKPTFGPELLKAMRLARNQMKEVGKSGHNDSDNYDYSTLGDYITPAEKAMGEHGLLLVVAKITPAYSQSHSGRMPACCRVMVTGNLFHVESGQYMPVEGQGEAFDRNDKALYKSITGARKYLIASLFNLYTGDDPEFDVEEPEDQPPARQQQKQRTPPKSQSKNNSLSTRKTNSKKAAAPKNDSKPTSADQILATKSDKEVKELLVKWHKGRPPAADNREAWFEILDKADSHGVQWGKDHAAIPVMAAITEDLKAVSEG